MYRSTTILYQYTAVQLTYIIFKSTTDKPYLTEVPLTYKYVQQCNRTTFISEVKLTTLVYMSTTDLNQCTAVQLTYILIQHFN